MLFEEHCMIIKKPRCGILKYFLYGFGLILAVVLVTTYFYGTSNGDTLDIMGKKQNKNYQYGVIIDAGSSGSRVFLYRWPSPTHDSSEELLQIEQMKDKTGEVMAMRTNPGLSAFADNPMASYPSLKPLILYAAMNIPRKLHRETPLYILCTAGMRMLAEEKRGNIINHLASKIPQDFSFFFKPSHIEVIDGRMEGVYGWIAVNYMLGKFSHDKTMYNELHPSTVGALDMGGASAQITYEVPKSEVLPADLTMEIDLSCKKHPGVTKHTYKLYTVSHLGFGANEARYRYVEELVKKLNIPSDSTNVRTVTDPCLPKGMRETEASHNVKRLVLKGSGNFTQCRESLYPLLGIPTTCKISPCSINGVFQPPINFYQQEMYGFSEYWYTMDDVLQIGGLYHEDKFIRAASKYCSTDWKVLNEKLRSGKFPRADQSRFHYQCFKSAWVLAMLHDGHRFPSNYQHFITANTVNNEEVQWTYGAMIYRTRYLPLQGDVNKHVSVTVSKYDNLLYYTLMLCFLVVIVAIAYYLRKIRRLRTSSSLPTHHKASFSPSFYKTLSSTASMINFEDVCSPPNQPSTGGNAIPRSYSESLLNRDIGASKVSPIFLGE